MRWLNWHAWSHRCGCSSSGEPLRGEWFCADRVVMNATGFVGTSNHAARRVAGAGQWAEGRSGRTQDRAI
jgi:hypothetical protein